MFRPRAPLFSCLGGAALATALTAALSCPAAWAQPLAEVPPPPRLADTPVPARSASNAASAPAPAQARSPAKAAPAASAVPSNTRVIEDDDVRIEESRGERGQLQRITVRSKSGNGGNSGNNKRYEIIVGPGGQDPSQPRGTTGQRAWSLFDF